MEWNRKYKLERLALLEKELHRPPKTRPAPARRRELSASAIARREKRNAAIENLRVERELESAAKREENQLRLLEEERERKLRRLELIHVFREMTRGVWVKPRIPLELAVLVKEGHLPGLLPVKDAHPSDPEIEYADTLEGQAA